MGSENQKAKKAEAENAEPTSSKTKKRSKSKTHTKSSTKTPEVPTENGTSDDSKRGETNKSSYKQSSAQSSRPKVKSPKKVSVEKPRVRQTTYSSEYSLVVALDIGTSFSGYAFSFKATPKDILMNPNWGQQLGIQSYKTATTLLVNSDGELEAFGFDAESKYAQLIDDDPSNEFKLFRRFKSQLYSLQVEDSLSSSSTVRSMDGYDMSIVEVYALSLSYFKTHAENYIQKLTHSLPDEGDIRWVITVPVTWSETAVDIIKEAAVEADLVGSQDSPNLVIAIDAETASHFVRNINHDDFCNTNSSTMNIPDRFVVLDVGGGTIAATVIEKDYPSDRCLFFMSSPAWDGTKLQLKLENLLCDILGREFVSYFQSIRAEQWLHMVIDFEKARRAAVPGGGNVRLTIPYEFGIQYEEYANKRLADAFEESDRDGVSFKKGSMVLTEDETNTVFDELLMHSLGLMTTIEANFSDISTYFLVGGLGECAFLQAILASELSRKRLMIPLEASLANLKGAVQWGHQPKSFPGTINLDP